MYPVINVHNSTSWNDQIEFCCTKNFHSSRQRQNFLSDACKWTTIFDLFGEFKTWCARPLVTITCTAGDRTSFLSRPIYYQQICDGRTKPNAQERRTEKVVVSPHHLCPILQLGGEYISVYNRTVIKGWDNPLSEWTWNNLLRFTRLWLRAVEPHSSTVAEPGVLLQSTRIQIKMFSSGLSTRTAHLLQWLHTAIQDVLRRFLCFKLCKKGIFSVVKCRRVWLNTLPQAGMVTILKQEH